MGAPDPRVPGWKAACADGTITHDEYAEMVKWMRGERRAAEELATIKKGAKGKRKKKETENDDQT